MGDMRRYLGQAILYALFFVPLVYLTQSPEHRHLDDDMAVLKIAIRHAGQIIGECRQLTPSEYAEQAANMKRAEICPRERSPLKLKLTLDDETLYSATVPASGLHSDGVSSMYRRLTVPAGTYQLRLQMNDDVATDGYPWQFEREIELKPAQVMVASFKEGFKLQ